MIITELYEREQKFQMKETEQDLIQIRLCNRMRRAQRVREKMSNESTSTEGEIMENPQLREDLQSSSE